VAAVVSRHKNVSTCKGVPTTLPLTVKLTFQLICVPSRACRRGEHRLALLGHWTQDTKLNLHNNYLQQTGRTVTRTSVPPPRKRKRGERVGLPPGPHPPVPQAYTRSGAGTTPPGFRVKASCKHTQNGKQHIRLPRTSEHGGQQGRKAGASTGTKETHGNEPTPTPQPIGMPQRAVNEEVPSGPS